jgi:hypothetical protein
MSFQPKQKFLLIAPIIVLPFLFLMFYALGGGRGQSNNPSANPMGLNTHLPVPLLNSRLELLNKLKLYAEADMDSARKKESAQRDPYIGKRPPVFNPTPVKTDPKADQLLHQLTQLQQSMRQPPPPPPAPTPPPTFRMPPRPTTPDNDPQLDRVNTMLDKVLRIQHPAENKAPQPVTDNATELVPADSASNAIAAVIPIDQTLVTGGTIALRLSEDARLRDILIPTGQLIYGTVTISNDRMMIHIRSLRNDRSIYATDLQAYDLDGLPGIHIPGMISRDVAKQSADAGVNGINLSSYDPSIGAQAANAGIQAAKTLFGRKVRLVRVSVRAGYQVLLRSDRPASHQPTENRRDVHSTIGKVYQPPGFVPGGSFLLRSKSEGVALDLQQISLQDSLLWIALRWTNHSPIAFVPDYCRWLIRDRHSFTRTAQQEMPVTPMYAPTLPTVTGDSTVNQWIGFRPFALQKDKELVLEVGEKGGGRTLTLEIDHRKILHAKWIEP